MLTGAAHAVEEDLDVQLDAEAEDAESTEIFRRLGMPSEELATAPLTRPSGVEPVTSGSVCVRSTDLAQAVPELVDALRLPGGHDLVVVDARRGLLRRRRGGLRFRREGRRCDAVPIEAATTRP